MNRNDASVLDIDTAAKRVLTFAAGLNQAELANNEEKQSAIVYQLIIIGEATKRLSSEFRAAHSSIPWKEITGMRDVLAHQYDKIDADELWGVVQRDIPELINLIKPLLS